MLKKLLLAALSIFVSSPLFAQTPPPDTAPREYKGPVVIGDRVPPPPSSMPKPPSGGVLNGKAIKLPKPAYPRDAREARAQGTVNVEVLIDEEGRVVSATALSGDPLLREAAVIAAKGAIFNPTLLEGQPVKVSGIITYNFVLDTPAAAGPTKTEPKQSTNSNDLILKLGAVLSFIQTGDSEFQKEMIGGQAFAEILRTLAADMAEVLGTEKGLFDELANANENERPAVAARLSEVIKKTLNEDQKWHLLAGMRIGNVIFEFARIAKNGAPPDGDRIDTSILEPRLRLLNDLLASAPAAASPDLVLKLRNIGAWANTKDLGAPENLMGLLKATEEFIISMIK